MKYISIFLVFLMVLVSSCSKEANIPQEPDTTPRFQYTKEKVYLFDVKLYSDVMHFFKYKTTVLQTNPNSSVSPESLKQMEDSINSIISTPTSAFPWNPKEQIIINDIGYDINNYEFSDFNLLFYASKGSGDTFEYVTSKYSKFGRDSIINLFNRQNISGHFTTFENRPTTFRPIIDVDFRLNPVGFEDGDDPFFVFCDPKIGYSSDIQVPANSSFRLPTVMQKPEIYQNEHALVYDRFNEREYECEDGTKYKTLVVVKKLTDMKDFDASAACSDKPNLTKTYPVMQFYKNDELWLEAWISKYAEEFEYNRADDKTTTGIEFTCYTLKDGYQYWICYEYDGPRLKIYISDFSKPNGSDKFTRVDIQNIRFINDRKDNAKATTSVE